MATRQLVLFLRLTCSSGITLSMDILESPPVWSWGSVVEEKEHGLCRHRALGLNPTFLEEGYLMSADIC